MAPALVDTVKELGLVVVVDTSGEAKDGAAQSSANMPEGVNGILKGNSTLRFFESVDM